MATPHWSSARFSTPRPAIWQSIERRHDDVHYDCFEHLVSKRGNPVYWTLVQYSRGGIKGWRVKGRVSEGESESRRQGDKERRERAHSVGCCVGRLAPFRSRQEAKQSQIKIRNPNIEIRNKLKNLNTNYEIPKPFVWNFVFLIDAEAVSRFRVVPRLLCTHDHLHRLDVGRHGHDATHRACVGNELLDIRPRVDDPDKYDVARVHGDVDPA
jgi:hypothetical protein